MNIPDVRDFDAIAAMRELLADGYTAVDDIGGLLYQHAEEELLDALGFAADDIEIVTDRIDTSFGPVFVFRNPSRVTANQVAAEVRKYRP